MSGAKFASITAGLLARKGEAQPWRELAADLATDLGAELASLDKTPLSWRPPAAAMAAPPPPPGKDRSCSVRMSAHDYERLGILAVKAGSSRQQLLKDALTQLLAVKGRDYGCACLGACDRGCAGGD